MGKFRELTLDELDCVSGGDGVYNSPNSNDSGNSSDGTAGSFGQSSYDAPQTAFEVFTASLTSMLAANTAWIDSTVASVQTWTTNFLNEQGVAAVNEINASNSGVQLVQATTPDQLQASSADEIVVTSGLNHSEIQMVNSWTDGVVGAAGAGLANYLSKGGGAFVQGAASTMGGTVALTLDDVKTAVFDELAHAYEAARADHSFLYSNGEQK